MHAARVLSLKRKQSLERKRRARLHRGLPNGDLSLSIDAESPSWYADKLDERRSAFASAKNAKGLSLFHMFAVIALLGAGLMLASLFVSSQVLPGLLEIGVSAILFSIFCLIFVRCDDSPPDYSKNDTFTPLDDIVIENIENNENYDTVGSDTTVTSKISSSSNESSDDQIKSHLSRSSPRKIPSPLRPFGYGHNFSPIQEVSEPNSSVSSFMTRNSSDIGLSKLAKSFTNDSLTSGNRGRRASQLSQVGVSSGGSPIDEEDLLEFEAKRDVENDVDFGNMENVENVDVDGLSVDNFNYSNSASFDTDDSITADLSVVTVIERKISESGSGANTPTPTP